MKEIGSMTKQMDKEFILTWMVQCIKGNGEKTNSMEKEEKRGLIKLCMKVIMMMEENMGWGIFNGRMGLNIKGNLIITILKESASINGLMGELIMENGSITRCTEKEYLHGKTGENTKENIIKIKKKVLGYFIGLMGESM